MSGGSRSVATTPTNASSSSSRSNNTSMDLFQTLFVDLGKQAMAFEKILRVLCNKMDVLDKWLTEISFGMSELDVKLGNIAHNIEGTTGDQEDTSSRKRWAPPLVDSLALEDPQEPAASMDQTSELSQKKQMLSRLASNLLLTLVDKTGATTQMDPPDAATTTKASGATAAAALSSAATFKKRKKKKDKENAATASSSNEAKAVTQKATKQPPAPALAAEPAKDESTVVQEPPALEKQSSVRKASTLETLRRLPSGRSQKNLLASSAEQLQAPETASKPVEQPGFDEHVASQPSPNVDEQHEAVEQQEPVPSIVSDPEPTPQVPTNPKHEQEQEEQTHSRLKAADPHQQAMTNPSESKAETPSSDDIQNDQSDPSLVPLGLSPQMRESPQQVHEDAKTDNQVPVDATTHDQNLSLQTEQEPFAASDDKRSSTGASEELKVQVSSPTTLQLDAEPLAVVELSPASEATSSESTGMTARSSPEPMVQTIAPAEQQEPVAPPVRQAPAMPPELDPPSQMQPANELLDDPHKPTVVAEPKGGILTRKSSSRRRLSENPRKMSSSKSLRRLSRQESAQTVAQLAADALSPPRKGRRSSSSRKLSISVPPLPSNPNDSTVSALSTSQMVTPATALSNSDGDDDDDNDDNDNDDEEDGSSRSDTSESEPTEPNSDPTSALRRRISQQTSQQLSKKQQERERFLTDPVYAQALRERGQSLWRRLRDHVHEEAKKRTSSNILFKRKKNLFTVSFRMELLEEKSRELFSIVKQLTNAMKTKLDSSAIDATRRYVQDMELNMQLLERKVMTTTSPLASRMDNLTEAMSKMQQESHEQRVFWQKMCLDQQQSAAQLMEQMRQRVEQTVGSLHDQVNIMKLEMEHKHVELMDVSIMLDSLQHSMRKKADATSVRSLQTRLTNLTKPEDDDDDCLVRCLSCHKELAPALLARQEQQQQIQQHLPPQQPLIHLDTGQDVSKRIVNAFPAPKLRRLGSAHSSPTPAHHSAAPTPMAASGQPPQVPVLPMNETLQPNEAPMLEEPYLTPFTARSACNSPASSRAKQLHIDLELHLNNPSRQISASVVLQKKRGVASKYKVPTAIGSSGLGAGGGSGGGGGISDTSEK